MYREEGAFGNYKGKFNLAKDFYKTKGWKFMGESKIDVGIFVVASGRWELDNDVPDVKTKNVRLKVGSGITVAYSFSWVISYPIGPVPVYLSFTLGISAGFAMEHSLSFCWVNGRFQNWELRPYNEITISITLSLSAALVILVNLPFFFSVSISAAPQYPIPERRPPISWKIESSTDPL